MRREEIHGAFEKQWRAGIRPSLELYLERVEPRERSALLWELLGLEVELRRQGGEAPRAEEYLKRLPDHRQLVQLFFSGEYNSGAAAEGIEAQSGASTTDLLVSIRTECPRRETLLSYFARSQSVVDAEEVHEHLVVCERCRETARELHAAGPIRSLTEEALSFTGDGRGEGPAEAKDEEPGSPRGVLTSIQSSPGKSARSILRLSDPLSQSDPGAIDYGATAGWRGTQVDQFLLLDLLGIGGMGAVYKAADARLGRIVALKVLLPRFAMDEARAAAQLEHENVTRLYQTGVFRGESYIVMDFVDGINLQDLTSELGVLAPEAAIPLVVQAACGIEAAHEKGLVHRDIKPANLMVTRTGKIKVLDFGLAREVHLLKLRHEVAGTPLFMAPEQWNGEGVDFRSDVFSLTGTLMYLVSGEKPVDASVSGGFHRVRPLATWLPRPLAELLAHGLAIRPEDRFPSMKELRLALEAIAAEDLSVRRSPRPGVSLDRLAFRLRGTEKASASSVIEIAARKARKNLRKKWRREIIMIALFVAAIIAMIALLGTWS